MSELLKDPMVLREILLDHYEYPHNHKLTDNPAFKEAHMSSESCIDISVYRPRSLTVSLKMSVLTAVPVPFQLRAHP